MNEMESVENMEKQCNDIMNETVPFFNNGASQRLSLQGFHHLANYPSNYYSYLFAKAQSFKLFEKHFSANPSNADIGYSLRKSVLSKGGTKKNIIETLHSI